MQPLYKGVPRLESRLYIDIYEQDPSHNKTLLKFAKLDFNLLQSLHKAELRDFNRWWNDGCFATKIPFARERVAEGYFWACGVFHEPQYALLRKIASKSCLALTTIDDLYDAYGTIEELELFTAAVERWDKDCSNYLPDYMKFVYQSLVLDLFEEFEQDLAKEGRSSCVYYAREQFNVICKSYLKEAKWRQEKYIPTYDEYMDCAMTTFGYRFATTVSHLGMGQIATRETFQLFSQFPKILRASSIIGRLKDDMAGYEINRSRDHVSSAVECYMRQYGVTKEYAYKELNKQVDDAWKSITEEMLKPVIAPVPLLTCILNLTRVVEVLYTGVDHFTSVSKALKDTIAMLFIDPILS
ncbi:hypothetical protein Nepgr_007698 [Nepenthes gracilis]|uniref:Terpene synthase metal-binding domain-containing protein n=1 Tax=Nepenthes gracilis TaxID=150966 RepID=A0AAD3S7J6_NEPGR|nr:hypothetical protein Nepgr_007698 [Nepenthes gracilis]